jgi:hypothetical protein
MDAGRTLATIRCCTFRCEGVGTFFPEDDATPAVGKRNMLSEVKENRIEIIVAKGDLSTVVNAVEHVHPYESVAYDVYPLKARDYQAGLGRVGKLSSPMTLKAFCRPVEIRVEPVDVVKVVGKPKWRSRRSRCAPGSGSSLMNAAESLRVPRPM